MSALPPVERAVAGALGVEVREAQPLGAGSSGSGAVLTRLRLADGRDVVAKRAEGTFHGLELEAWMLGRLAEAGLSVPAVHHADDRLLVMDHCPTDGRLDGAAEEHVADALAALHDRPAPRFGLDRDTVIGPLPQPNPEEDDWRVFFAEQRLRRFARAALEEDRIDAELVSAIDGLCGRLDRLIPDGVVPSLVHGDVWGGNVLVGAGGAVRFIDPAIYHADAEVDLAYATLFGTLGERFFARYQERRPLEPGFFEARRDLYNLYPLLVHVRLFGGSYARQVARIVRRLA